MLEQNIWDLLGNTARRFSGAARIGVAAFGRVPGGNLQDVLDRYIAQMLVPPGGTTGQALTKSSNTDNDVGWSAASGTPAGVTSFGPSGSPRTGVVTPASGDYSYAQITGAPAVASQAQADAGTDDATIMTPLKSANMLRISPTEVSVTGATTLTTAAFGKMHILSGTTADYTVGLPATAGNVGRVISFRGSSALTKLVTLDANASETIDGALTIVLMAYESITLESTGTEWVVIPRNNRRPVGIFRGSNAAGQTGIVTGTLTKLNYDTEDIDVSGWFVPGTGATQSRFTPQKRGWYLIAGHVLYDSALVVANKAIQFLLYKNGSVYKALGYWHTASVWFGGGSGSVRVWCNGTTDYIELWTSHTFGANASIYASATYNYFEGHYLGDTLIEAG